MSVGYEIYRFQYSAVFIALLRMQYFYMFTFQTSLSRKKEGKFHPIMGHEGTEEE